MSFPKRYISPTLYLSLALCIARSLYLSLARCISLSLCSVSLKIHVFQPSFFCSTGSNFYTTENTPWWHRAGIHLPNIWTLLPCGHDTCKFKDNQYSKYYTFVDIGCLLNNFLYNCLFQGKMVLQLSKEPSARLLKHVVRCYLRLSDNSRYWNQLFDPLLLVSFSLRSFLQCFWSNFPGMTKKTYWGNDVGNWKQWMWSWSW